MGEIRITDSIRYIGVDDKELDLFESQYIVPNGMAYNSYIIKDEKTAVMDSVDAHKTQEWLDNLKAELGEAQPDYLVVSHMEPDHSGSLMKFMERYPNTKIVASQMAVTMIGQFFENVDLEGKVIISKEGESLSLGKHTLRFIAAPMVHWPEVMMSYEESEKVLFSADAFGKFGTLDTDEDWACEARRYYFNIVGKYGAQVQAVLAKVLANEVNVICPLHGPILSKDLGQYIEKYRIWSKYETETDGVFIACASIHGNTWKAANKLKEILEAKGAPKVAITDLTRDDHAEAVEDAFRYNRLVLCASSYDAGVFMPMDAYLRRLVHKGYQNKTIAMVENGTWAPSAARTMKAIIEPLKNITLCENQVTIKSSLKQSDLASLEALADELLSK